MSLPAASSTAPEPKPAVPKPVVLCILDGWGEVPNGPANSIRRARKPNWDRFWRDCPHATIEASELNVGLPAGQMGNSEVGHMNLGAGRVVMQDLPRIDQAIEDGSLARSPELLAFIATLKKSGGVAHLMGLLSPGGVHSHQGHIAALARILSAAGLVVKVHAFLDGRDTPPQSALEYLAAFEAAISEATGASLATLSGRYYAMDRDKRWDRVSRAYAVLVSGEGGRATTPAKAVEASYIAQKTDEFLLPAAIGDYQGMTDGDGLLMCNFRADRAREILTALLDPAFDGFARQRTLRFAAALGMVEYSTDLNPLIGTIFPPEMPTETFGEIVSKAGLNQLRIAETEKYPHVTYFFNGGDERVFEGEERILVQSPKVATYDLQPEMSARELTDRLVEAIATDRFQVVVVNFANADMVGHSGMLDPAIRAIEALDDCLGRLADIVEAKGGSLLITADHGNAEQMVDPVTGAPHTAHTLNPVPVVLVGGPNWVSGLGTGKLADVAPTLLQLLDLPQPAAMTGRSLLVGAPANSTSFGSERE